MNAHVALLRGINVGGKNKLPMQELKELFAAAGCTGVRTYIASGNVLFDAPAAVVKKLAAQVSAAIEREHGLRVPVVLRTAQELSRVLRSNPFPGEPDAVMFLADEPAAGAVASLDRQRSPPDELVVLGREVYLRLPNGLARTKLTNAWLDSKLATVSTGRNWRTVQTLAELAGAG